MVKVCCVAEYNCGKSGRMIEEEAMKSHGRYIALVARLEETSSAANDLIAELKCYFCLDIFLKIYFSIFPRGGTFLEDIG